MLGLTSFCLILSTVNLCLCQQETVTVTIQQGELRGKVATTVNGLNYYSFLGIPYAKPPVGSLRFKDPQAAEPWDGIRDALELGPICPQIVSNEYMGDEDCLFVNVATPMLPANGSNELKPVMVNIHGGGFTQGSGSLTGTGPDFLLEEDVILVSMNYRLGALGFLSTGDSVIPGNNGLKDQVLALQWVQENIAKFGGDPRNVTIFGVSAGGCSVHYLILSPLGAGLFHKAIAQSGSALDQWGYEEPETAKTQAIKLCGFLGNSTTNSDEIAQFLLPLDAREIVEATEEAISHEENQVLVFFELTSEREVEAGEMVFLEDAPISIIKSGSFNQVPFISGTVTHEGSLLFPELLSNNSRLDYYDTHPEMIVPKDLKVYLSPEEIQALGLAIKQFYFGDESMTWKKLVQFTNLATDIAILYGLNRHVNLHAAASKSSVYQYQLSFNGRWGTTKNLIGDSIPAVSHGEDEAYLFYYEDLEYNNNSAEEIILKRMVKLWTNFAKTGNPTPEVDPLLQNIIWSPATSTDDFYLDIGNDLTVKRNLENDRMSFWDDIYASITG